MSCDGVLAWLLPRVSAKLRIMTQKYLLLISGPNSKNISSLQLQCIFSLTYLYTFINSSCLPRQLTILKGGIVPPPCHSPSEVPLENRRSFKKRRQRGVWVLGGEGSAQGALPLHCKPCRRRPQSKDPQWSQKVGTL